MSTTPPPSRRGFIASSLATLTTGALTRGFAAAQTSTRKPRVPKLAEPFVHIYRPGPDVFTLPTVTSPPKDGNITYEQGENYPEWRTNDHTFIKDDQNRWHCFGITKPWIPGDNGHAGEGLCFHAIASEGTFAQAATFQSWKDLPKIRLGTCGWAPTSLRFAGDFSLIDSHLGHVSSIDLLTWRDKGRLDAQGKGRDPAIFFWNDTYHLLRCAGNGVSVATSRDFQEWSEPSWIYQPAIASYQTESPFLLHHEGWFYLFWTLWDTEDPSTSGYCPRTFVHASESPLDFHNKPVLAEFTVHATEIIRDESGACFMSSADHPHRGVSVAPLKWE